jgi:hypothetical protein
MPRCCATILHTAHPAVAAKPSVAAGKDQPDPAVLVYCEVYHDDEETAQNAVVEAAKVAFAAVHPDAEAPDVITKVKPGRAKKSQIDAF